LIEATQTELQKLFLWRKQPYAVYFFTPLCGTCKLAERMLTVVEQMLPEIVLYQCNVNYAPFYVQDWEIRSVPCLVRIENQQKTAQIYAMKSVDELYQLLKPINIANPKR
jgi:thioredoxin-like negative regulator of GroEL